jgi:hypothetical protein
MSTPFGMAPIIGAPSPFEQPPANDVEPIVEVEEEIPDSEKYWAARSGDALCTELAAQERRFYEFAERRGYTLMWETMLAEYWGLTNEGFSFDSARMQREGEDSEHIRFRVNNMRRLMRQSIAMVLKGQPTFAVDAANTESQSRALASQLDDIATDVYTEHFGKRRERMIVERAKVYAKMWAWGRWDPDAGPHVEAPAAIDPATGQPLMMTQQPTGAPTIMLKRPWEVITVPTLDLGEPMPWACVKETISRWQVLAELKEPEPDPMTGVVDPALYQDYLATYEHIRKARVQDEIAYEAMFGFDADQAGEDDLIRKWFYHPPCEDLPHGRLAVIVAGKVVQDGDWMGFPGMSGAPQLPLVEYMPGAMEGSSLGYSDAWDLVPMQQVMTQMTGDAASNITTFGRQVIVIGDGTDVREEQLVNGMTVLRIPQGKDAPQGLNLAQIGQSWPHLMQFLQQAMQHQVGKEGDPSSASSGTMAALIDAIAMEHQGADIDELDHFRGKVCTLLLALIQQNATSEQLVSMAGSSGKATMRKFSAEKFSGTHRVRCKPISPVMKSRANQLQLLEMALKIPGLITDVQQLIEFFTSGTLKPATRIAEAQSRLIEWENEQLRKPGVPLAPDPDPAVVPTDPITGQPMGPPPMITPTVPVVAGQNARTHIPEHLAEAAMAETEEERAAFYAHIKWHERVDAATSPAFATLAGIPVSPTVQMQMAQMGAGEAANDNAGPPKKGVSVDAKVNDVDERGPRMPKPAEPPKGASAA